MNLVNRLNVIDLVLILGVLIVGGLLGALAMLKCPDQLLGAGGVIGAITGPLVTMYSIAKIGEWKARAADQSTIPQQEARMTDVLPNQKLAGA